jgi:hypothetical protein
MASSLEHVSNIPPVRLQDANSIQQRIFCIAQEKLDDFSELFCSIMTTQLVKKHMATKGTKK